ncbi:MAG: hypothetical protein ABIN89_29375, partial [Chitinophagaceae bacterium]
MTLKITIIILFLVGLKFVCSSFIKPVSLPVTPIDTTWWNELTEEWKTIFLVNQCFKKHGVDVFKLQNEYINRLNTGGENNYSEINTSLNELYDMRKFGLSYTDMYFRALQKNYVKTYNNIDLASLGELDTIYMVNGPGDLTPLRKFIHLKVLIINFCGIDNSLPISKQVLNLEPLEYLKELRILHCTSIALQSLKPIENLINLEELHCDNSSITTLAPLIKLKKLKKISFGSKVN